MLRTPILRAQSVAIPLRQTLPPQQIIKVIPPIHTEIIHRVTSYNPVDDIEIISQDGVEVSRKFWAAGTRETVSEISSHSSSADKDGTIDFTGSILRVVYAGPVRPTLVRKSLEGLALEGVAGVGNESGTLMIEDSDDGLVHEYFDAYSDIEAQRQEEADEQEQMDLERAMRALGRPASE